MKRREKKKKNSLRSIILWFQNNLLSSLMLNRTQPSIATFKSRMYYCPNFPSSPMCSCPTLEQRSFTKDLAIIIDELMSWQHLVDTTSARIRICFRKTQRLSSTIYFSLCQSIITYCIPIKGCMCETRFIKLKRAQSSVLKVIGRLSYRYPTKCLIAESKLLTARQLLVSNTITVST